ncbi:superoxide dismutase family protein [uncultured Sneathiella sp.]|jgi:Cu-Zn family superoxide dismutase|uniref:superoxide dismutase family protein n=1 Tax=uncultured Sneathiella sp. TaxID=879315 RepID=UPI0030D8C998|tara:strand:- start:741 stop:1394 length:654 start_codon:yes stop_codon:yes gene_type:complete
MKAESKCLNFGFNAGAFLLIAGLMICGIKDANSETSKTGNTTNSSNAEKPFTVLAGGKAQFVSTQNEEMGVAILQETANGVLIELKLRDMPPGRHAIHVHEKGACTPVGKTAGSNNKDYFSDAGGHLNPSGREHGLLNEGGPHAGDLLNIYIHQDGTLETYILNDRMTLNSENESGAAQLLDDDGAAFIIHEGTDDYRSQPSGDAGKRIACAVIKAD